MGLDTNGVRFLLEARQQGVRFDDCATLGRQEMQLTGAQLVAVYRKLRLDIDGPAAEALLRRKKGDASAYAEPFLMACGAASVTSIDYSDYEGASRVHDMNTEIPRDLRNRFTCLIDGGALEHIFNFPVAVSNCMKMITPGGHFLSITPCNNFMGHGFYQFSPEIFWGVFREGNGFTVERMYIFESRAHAPWHEVADPASVGGRVTLRNSKETYLLVQARKVSDSELKELRPQQSDYATAWRGPGSAAMPREQGGALAIARRVVPLKLKILLRRAEIGARRLAAGPFQAPFFRRYR